MAPIILRKLARAGRNRELTWRYVFNLTSTLAYQLGRRPLSAEVDRVQRELKEHGIAVTSAAALLENSLCYQALLEEVADLEAHHADQLAAARLSSEDTNAIGQKTFNVELLGEHPRLDLDSIYARFALQEEILQTANAYFGMYTRLRYFNVWHTLTTRSQPRESQLWHRDREDFHILKMFLYLCDVDEGAGPFTYATGSHIRSNISREPECFMEGNVKRSNDSQMAKVIPPSRWKMGAGPKGTIVFADTSGYHKGGLAREHDRIMYTCMFTSQASQSKEFMLRPAELSRPADKDVRFAVAS